MTSDPLAAARLAKSRVTDLVAKWPQVNGVGITREGEKFAVKVNLSEPAPAGFDVPKVVEGVAVVVEVVGRIKALCR